MTGTVNLNAELLRTLGYTQLTAAQGQQLLDEVRETLELMVGRALSKDLSTTQLAEFEQHVDRGEEEAASLWLAQHRPDYPQIVMRCYDVICGELGSLAQSHAATRRDSDIMARPLESDESEDTNE